MRPTKQTVEITLEELELSVVGYYTKSEPGTTHDLNGDPGDPPILANFEPEQVFVEVQSKKIDILPVLEKCNDLIYTIIKRHGVKNATFTDLLDEIKINCITKLEE